MDKNTSAMVSAAAPAMLGLAAVATVGAMGAAMARRRRPAKKMARKVARGAEKAVMQMDRMLRSF